MPFSQDIIHRLEEGGGMRYFKIGLAVLAVVGFTVGYNWRAYKNMSAQEAMDAAQLARNLAEGRGYTTLYVRPLSMFLLKRLHEKRGLPAEDGAIPDYSQIRRLHPDLANPPVYPVVLAGLLKVLPLETNAKTTKPFWSVGGQFYRYQPDFLISAFNQFLFFGLIASVFFLTRKLFDATAAWLSAILLFGTELFWRFAVSGLSTMLVLLIFVGLLWCLFFLEREAREPKWSPRALFGLAALSGVIVGVGCLTRYAFGWFIFPLVIYLAIFAGPRRLVLCLVALLAFVVVVAPWVARNVWACGAPFGTATFAALESTLMYPESRLVRSLTPEFERIYLPMFWYKLFVNGKVIITTEGPRFCGSWVAAFALAGLLVNFRNPACQRLRYFVLLCAPFLVVVQAMGRTQLSEDSLELNTENLLVLLAPIVIVYGVSFFLTLLDQLALPFAWLRYVVMAGFGLLVSVPMLLVFLPPKPGAVAYPPYNPPLIQEIAGWMRADELIMSDIPWAVAWYGKRQSVLITRDAQNEFFAINDTQKPVRALYLTQQTMDSRFLTLWVGDKSWHAFILDYITQRAVPPWFPLRAAPGGLWPSQLFLTDWERWRRSE